MSDLTPEQQAAYLRARALTRPDGIEQTLADLDRASDETPSLGRSFDRLCRDAATTIRSLQDQLARDRALGRMDADRDELAELRSIVLRLSETVYDEHMRYRDCPVCGTEGTIVGMHEDLECPWVRARDWAERRDA